MLIVGRSARKLRSNSSASTTIILPAPSFELESIVLTKPPTTNVGSRCPSDNTVPIMEEVVVFPCVPPTPMLVSLTAINSPSISALRITGMFFSYAAWISGLSFWTALEYTNTSASVRLMTL